MVVLLRLGFVIRGRMPPQPTPLLIVQNPQKEVAGFKWSPEGRRILLEPSSSMPTIEKSGMNLYRGVGGYIVKPAIRRIWGAFIVASATLAIIPYCQTGV